MTMDEHSSSVTASDDAANVTLVGSPVVVVESERDGAVSVGHEFTFREAISRTLDDVDALADAVAHALGLRDR